MFCVLLLQLYDGDVKELSLDFTVTEESFGKRHVIELKPGGKDLCVTDENKMQYVHEIADYKLNRQVCNCYCTIRWQNIFYNMNLPCF
jgi:ubiquitin-protein ligase E3 B